MFDSWDSFLRNDEQQALSREKREKRSLVVDYEDGGEMQCGLCKGPCFRHFSDGNRNDIGECCARRAA
jgi:hypothetical protein